MVAECWADLARATPMMRLVQGDVGSGKTVVAALAMARAVESGFQAALMAPTEILAEQHFRNLDAWFQPLGVAVEWLAGKQTAEARALAEARVRSGNAKLVVGTQNRECRRGNEQFLVRGRMKEQIGIALIQDFILAQGGYFDAGDGARQRRVGQNPIDTRM